MIRIPEQRDGHTTSAPGWDFPPQPSQTFCQCGVPGCSGSSPYSKGA